MASLTAVQRRRSGKLSLVNVFVAILALRSRNLEFRILAFLAFRHVALIAGHCYVEGFQWIFRRDMFFDAKRGRLPPVFRVARLAFTAVGTRSELPVMRFLVAIGAFGVSHRRFEIAMGVAIAASNRLVFSNQRKFCFRVVETFHLSYTGPTRSHVTTVAGCLEGSLMRVGVASTAFREGKARVFDVRLSVLDNRVALHAIHFLVRSGERIFRCGVIEA